MSSPGSRPVVLVPFDRSSDSEAAIARVCGLMPDAEMTVLTVWQSTEQTRDLDGPTNSASDAIVGSTDITDQDVALSRATIGARHAAQAGVLARPRVQRAPEGVVGAIVAVADELHADFVVMGRHGRSGQRYRELGETVRGVLEHTGRPVLVVSGHDVPHVTDGSEGTASEGHGGVHVGAWVPKTPEDEQDGTA